MHIVINHLTRMQPGYICVAGVIPESGEHIRPVLRGRLTRSMLRAEGGPFDLGALVDLGETIGGGAAPEVEDRAFTAWMASYVRSYEPAAFWTLLQACAQRRLSDIFGPDLQRTNVTCSLELDKGLASLGCLIPARGARLHMDERNNVRMRFSDADYEVSAPVTDLRFYHDDQQAPRREAVTDVNARLARGVPVVLSVGVTRPWQKPGDTAPRHWLQINGVHLADKPLWGQAEAARAAARPPRTSGLDEIPF